jgi:hypothetical protein
MLIYLTTQLPDWSTYNRPAPGFSQIEPFGIPEVEGVEYDVTMSA